MIKKWYEKPVVSNKINGISLRLKIPQDSNKIKFSQKNP